MLSTWFALATAGLGHLVWHWGLGIGCIILLLAAAWLSEMIPLIGPFLTKERWALFAAAGAIALLLVGEGIGLRDGTDRCIAKTVVIEKAVDKAVKETQTPAAKSQRDPWDNPDN